MAETNFTLEMLAALEKAIASGTQQVMYGDKLVMYKTLEEMLKARDLMRKELGLVEGRRKIIRPEFSKGL